MLKNNSLKDEIIPYQFHLGQNYPNPFKDKTIIKYCIAYKTRVKLTVYNSEGKEIEKLVDEEKTAGTYEIEFNASADLSGENRNLPNGYYFYRMIAGDYSSEKKWFCINNLIGRINMKTLFQTLFFFLLVTQICFAQWVQLGLADRHIGEIAVGSTGLFAVTSENGSVFRTTDGGASWYQILDSLGTHVAVAANGTTFMAVGDSLYRSTDGGTSWINLHLLEQVNVGSMRRNIYCVAIGPYGNIFSGFWAKHVVENVSGDVPAISTDNGTTWNWGGFWGGKAFSFRGHSVMTYGFYSSVTTGTSCHSLSFDDGLTWSSIGDSSCPFFSPPFSWCTNGNIIGNAIFFQGVSGLAVSMDTCASLMKISDISPSALLALPQGRVLVGTDTTGICLFSDNGDSLGTLNEGLSDFHIHAFAMDSSGGYAYVGTDNGVWRRPVSELIVSVNPLTSRLPTEFLLSQNFPNPFNPSTKIKYSVPNSSRVVIKVFDILGNVIETLVSKEKPVGTYEFIWYAENLPSGVYFYQLKAGDYVSTKKMILLK